MMKLRELCLSKWYLIYLICIFSCLVSLLVKNVITRSLCVMGRVSYSLPFSFEVRMSCNIIYRTWFLDALTIKALPFSGTHRWPLHD